jgi:hypothetical protein
MTLTLPSTEAVDRDLLSIQVAGCVARRQSLTILSPEGFEAAGRALAEFDSCSQWLWSDYLSYAQEHGYKTVLDMARENLHRSTIYAYLDCGRFYPVADRHPELSFGHHQSVMYILGIKGSLASAKRWLARAAEKEWTVGELREAMRRDKRKDENDPGPMRGEVRITDFVKVSKWTATVKIKDFPPEQLKELRDATGPLFDFLCQLHRASFTELPLP